MIRVRCHCGGVYDEPDEHAGLTVQCSRCGRLCDVPSLSDLAGMDDDGVYRMSDVPVQPDPKQFARAYETFTRSRTAADGHQYDLRSTLEEQGRMGVEEKGADLTDGRASRPKYDPLTGELIRPIEVREEQPVPAEHAPVPYARTVLQYGSEQGYSGGSFWKMFLGLFSPANLVVILVVGVAHVLLSMVWTTIRAGMFLVLPGWLLLWMLILAYWSEVVEETGPGEIDELPRPLRNASVGDDIWRPFVRSAVAVGLTFWPALLVGWLPEVWQKPGLLLAGLLGLFLFPAVFLTASTSGSNANLRPDRIWSVVRATGVRYVGIALLGSLSLVTYLGGLLGTEVSVDRLFQRRPALPVAVHLLWGLLFLGILLMHLFCWRLGLLYREFSEKFNWVYQRHHSTRRDEMYRAARAARLARANANSAKVRSKLGSV
jgi:hypothetical protein